MITVCDRPQSAELLLKKQILADFLHIEVIIMQSPSHSRSFSHFFPCIIHAGPCIPWHGLGKSPANRSRGPPKLIDKREHFTCYIVYCQCGWQAPVCWPSPFYPPPAPQSFLPPNGRLKTSTSLF